MDSGGRGDALERFMGFVMERPGLRRAEVVIGHVGEWAKGMSFSSG